MTDPDVPLHRLEILDAEERHTLLEKFNATDRKVPKTTLPALFEAQVKRTPDAVAVVFGEGSLTYRELNERANRLAHHLIGLEVGPEDIVGLSLGRSFEMVVALLGVLKAGAAYMPLDPMYPEARIQEMMSDAEPVYVLTEKWFLEKQTTLDRAAERNPGQAERRSQLLPHHPANLIFTSGSTGKPTGVLNTHEGLVNRILWMQDAYELNATDRILQKTPYSFDVSGWEFFWPLFFGARLVVALPGKHGDPQYLIRTIIEQGITTIHFVPSMLRVFLGDSDCSACRNLRRVISSGEALLSDLQSLFFEKLAGVQLHNLYGPTEASIDVTAWTCRDGDDSMPPPIGTPVWNTRIYVLDACLEPVPVGVIGELFIAGVQLAQGYLKRPALTAERFVPDPHGKPGTRMFRTGDLARWRADGNLEYLGRTDGQVKIRGFRIELGEIESALAAQAGVAQAAVTVREDGSGGKQLLGYLVPTAGTTPDAAVLRRALRERLPDYMVPSALALISALPLTSSGKLDRRALAALLSAEARRRDIALPQSSPSGKLDRGALLASLTESGNEPESLDSGSSAEMRLRTLCHRAIGASPVRSESLLEIGLHSLSAASLVSLIQEEFHVRLRLSDVLDDPTMTKLLALIEDGSRSEPDRAPPSSIKVQPHPKSLPLSFAQEQVWFLEKLHPRLNCYRFQALFNCVGALNVNVLEASLNETVRRHEILRTAFVVGEGETPCQDIRPHVPIALPFEDLRVLPAEARNKALERLIEEELRRPFHLGDPPLIRWRLYQLDEQKYSLLHTEHHFLHDGWAYGVFLDELYSTYVDLADGKKANSEPPPMQFADFALWQRKMMASGAWDHQLDYWRKQLADCPPPPQLPSDRRLGRYRNFEGLQIRHPIPEAFWTELRQACSREGVTRFAWIQAVFHLFIHLYTGADDFCTGTGFANRRDPRFHKMLGMAINTLPIRANFEGIATFRDLLRRTQERLRFALDNQELPFEIVVKDLNPGREPNNNPLFNAFLASYDRAYPALVTETLEISTEDTISCGQVKFDLVALLLPGRHVAGKQSTADQTVPLLLWEFSSELFDFSTGECMLNRFLGLLESSVHQPDAPVGSLSMARHDEVNRVLAFGRGPEAPPQCETPLHRLFESVVAAAPNSPAVAAGETLLSYRELNLRANILASRLARRGIAEGSIAAVALPRGPDAIVCFLAILKAGGAYLPIDSRDPEDRISSLLRLAGARMILTNSSLAASLTAAAAGAEVCLIDEPFEATEGNLSISVSANAPAHILFTSGSTGVPKGVIVPHRAVSRLVFGLPVVHLDRSEIILHLAPLNFDASTLEIWGALLHGAKLVISCDDLPDFRSLGETILRHGITTTWLTSSLFNQIIDTSPEILRGLRQVLTGGEALSPRHIRKALDLLPGTLIVNGYGPTEATTFATLFQVPGDFDEASRAVPIGRPIAGTQVYVMSNGGGSTTGGSTEKTQVRGSQTPRLAPIGVPGELYIGGDGVALGYLNSSESTAERFAADPFAKLPGGRLYRTGDLVRWRPDGNLDFLGRIDDQVKIRGFRIEPGEIEAVLEQHPSVKTAFVRIWERAPGDKQLAAYYEADGPSEPADLHELLGSRLPRYMLPVALIRMSKLPLTPAGKVDWRALPKPDAARTQTYVAPRNAIEEQLAAIWSRLLGVERVGIHDDFFELGGHSLLAIQVVAALRGTLHIEIPVTALFNNPTVSGLSRYIDELVAHNLETVRPPIEKVSRDQPLPLSFAQQRLWRNERDATSPDNVNVILLDVKGDLNISCLERSLQELVRRHEVFRTTFHVIGDSPVQRIAPDRPFKLNVLDLSQMPDSEAAAARFALKEKTDSISLEHGPLMRFSALRFGTHHHRLVLKLHHILYDTWSLPIFHRELDALYHAFCQGKDSLLPELRVQLADFAVWQRRYLDPNSSSFRAQLAYWRKQLSGNLPVLRLACERPSELTTASIEDVLTSFETSEEFSASLRAFAKREGTTLFITFLTALKALMNVSTGQNDIMLGVYMAKRNAPESDRMMGYFCDIGVLRTSVSSDLSFLELLRRVRETVLNAHANEDMPFDVLGEELKKSGQAPPDLRAIFMFESFSESSRLGDLEVNQLTIATRTTMPWRFQMQVRDAGRVFCGWAKFDARLHDPQLVRRMVRNYVRLLEAVVKEPGSRLYDAATNAELDGQIPDSADRGT